MDIKVNVEERCIITASDEKENIDVIITAVKFDDSDTAHIVIDGRTIGIKSTKRLRVLLEVMREALNKYYEIMSKKHEEDDEGFRR